MATARASAPIPSAPLPSREAPAESDAPARWLEWSYRRNDELLRCVLALTPDHTAYEFRVFPSQFSPEAISELFDDAIAAFQRQGSLERSLLSQGWCLEGFEHNRGGFDQKREDGASGQDETSAGPQTGLGGSA